MVPGSFLLLLVGLVAWLWAWQANGRTTLRSPLLWTLGAWVAWLLALWGAGTGGTLERYLALSLTGCTGVALLGARRPGAGGWNLVVAGLLAVFLLPVAEGLGRPRLQPAHLGFLAVTLAVLVLNYLPTRLAGAALLLGASCTVQLAWLAGRTGIAVNLPAADWLLACCPWAALLSLAWRQVPPTELDRLWLEFRDRFGWLWAQRQREQFNQAAANGKLGIILTWSGVAWSGYHATLPDPVLAEKLLRSVLIRFELEYQTLPARRSSEG